MKCLVLFALFAVAAARLSIFDPELNEHWENFKKVFGKNYNEREEVTRRLIWERRLADIVRHNLRYDLGLHSFRKGLNEYSDMPHEEFVKTFNGYRGKPGHKSNGTTWVPVSNAYIPDQVDWRDKGLVTPVKNQDGTCHFKRSAVGATVTGYVDIPTGDEEALKKAVATVGPISVAIDASHDSFQTYHWGTTWGIKGYIKMARNKDNQCGIATQASYPLV
ncbi:Cathepsin L like protein [Argiope bruennichi]|uniref:Cathepsin L like protein n=1 Tax=Argiope bruennichi TaxID=94029 RepID=A0A8T0G2U9_ARGBR|nr:Cathepsin L like protein [Argiope bruennichi]